MMRPATYRLANPLTRESNSLTDYLAELQEHVGNTKILGSEDILIERLRQQFIALVDHQIQLLADADYRYSSYGHKRRPRQWWRVVDDQTSILRLRYGVELMNPNKSIQCPTGDLKQVLTRIKQDTKAGKLDQELLEAHRRYNKKRSGKAARQRKPARTKPRSPTGRNGRHT